MILREERVATYDKLVSVTWNDVIIVCKQHPDALLMFLSKVSEATTNNQIFIVIFSLFASGQFTVYSPHYDPC